MTPAARAASGPASHQARRRPSSRAACSVSLLALLVVLLSPGLARAALPAGQIETYTVPTANANPTSITAGPNGDLWFNEEGANQIGEITTGGTITEFPTPTARPYAITAGPSGDDRLWFTDANNDEIGASSTAGSITEYPIPPVQNEAPVPEAITTGPDSALWFIETNGGADTIERIPTTATTMSPGITQFPVPTADAFATSITTGPDRNLWFTEQTGNKIGKLTPSGTFTEYPLPNPDSFPSGITSGPNGALWFTEFHQLGEISTDGTITEFPVGSPLGNGGATPDLGSIAAGPDGNLWFVAGIPDESSQWIGRMTPAGNVTYYLVTGPLITGPGIGGMTAGPDGNVWFTEGQGDVIGEIGTVAATAPGVSLSPAGGVDFGNSTLGETAGPLTVTLTNTGGQALTLGTVQLVAGTGTPFATTADECSGQTVQAGDTCTIGVTFSPTSAGSYSATLKFSDNAADSPQTLPVTGSSEPALSSAGLDFGSSPVGVVAGPSNVKIENTGGAPLSISGVTVTGAQAAAFQVTTDNCSGQTVAASDSCDVSVTFTPSQAGPNSAALSVSDDASGSPQSVSLTGTGVAPTAHVTPPNIDFGQITAGQSSSPQTVTMSNPGPGPLAVSNVQIVGADPGAFKASADTCSGQSVSADSSCTVRVTFSPMESGDDSASLQITDDAAGSPQLVDLTGISPQPADSLIGWGANYNGQLGDGTTVSQWSPESISLPGGVGVTAVSNTLEAGDEPFTLAVGTDGKIYAWGNNDDGQLGDGTTINRETPEAITLPGNVAAKAVSAGTDSSLAIGTDGTLYAWGANGGGQLGDGTTTGRDSPEAIALPAGVTATAVSAGSQNTSLAVGSDGKVYSWGGGTDTPQAITLASGVTATAVSAGPGFDLAIGSDGKVYGWGENEEGQLGDGTTAPQTSPIAVTLASGVTATAISAGPGFSLAVGSDGTVYSWGENSLGELGDGTETSRDTPEPISLPGGIRAASVSAGYLYSLAVGADGNVYAWGGRISGNQGELGNGTELGSTMPELINLPGDVTAAAVSAGSQFSFAVGSSAPVTPRFAAASPPDTALIGSSLDYTFVAAGFPPPAYSLDLGAPGWLSIDAASGQLSGTVPSGTTSFTYSVSATNSVGSTAAGPFTVAVTQPDTTVSGTVVDTDDNPVSGAVVDECVTAGGICQSATTTAAGAFSLAAVTGTTISLTAYPPPSGSGASLAPAVNAPVEVPSGGLAGQTLTVEDLTGIGQDVSVAPEINWGLPTPVQVTGCPNGLARATVIGANDETNELTSNTIELSETPEGSGVYDGTLPPQFPIHGSVEIDGSVDCPPSSALVPNVGPADGGNTVFVTGSGLTGTTGVDFGTVPAKSFTVLSDDGIEAVAPPGAGTVPVTVYGGSAPPGGTVIDQYTYGAIQSIAPASGPAAGNMWVVINGTGLGSATTVLFGQTAAEFYQLSDTEIEALSPPGDGTQDITVETEWGGTTSTSPADKFTYTGGDGAVAHASTSRPGPPFSGSRSGRLRSQVRLVVPTRLPIGTAARSSSLRASALGPFTSSGVRSAVLASPLLRAAPADSGLSLKVLSWLYEDAPKYLTGLSSLKSAIQGTLATLGGTCEGSQAALADVISIALNPFVDAVVDAALPSVLSAEAAVFGATPPVFLVAAALTPFVLNVIANEITDHLIDAAVKAVFGECPKKPPPPPPMPPPPGPGDNFSPNDLIDPSGTVLDSNGNPVSGATATILRSDASSGPFAAVDPTSPGIEPQTNPETTGADGTFHWDVDSGFYEVQATAPGCTAAGNPGQSTATAGPYPVPPPQVGLTVALSCPNEAPAPTPAVQSLSESTGPPSGGTQVMVLGSGFTPSSTVIFGGAQAQDVTFLSPEALTAVSPPGSGLEDVTVATAGGTSATSSADQFFYGSPPTISGLSVTDGPVAGGTRVTVTGTGFSGATVVGFGGLPGSSLVVDSDTQLQVTTPAEQAGTVDVEVVTPAGDSAATPADRYTFVSPAPSTPPPSPSPSPSATAPANTAAPVITGTPDVASTLICSTGTWSGTAPLTYAYQWVRDGVPISGATESSYTTVAADGGHSLSCSVTATNSAGSAIAGTAAVKIATTPPCSGLKGSPRAVCQAKTAYNAALAKCSTIKTKTRSGRKRKAACVATAKRNYQHALAVAKCQAIKNSHKRTACIAHARKELDVAHRVVDRRSQLSAGAPFYWGIISAEPLGGLLADQPSATAASTGVEELDPETGS